MTSLAWLAIAYAAAFVINVFPAFMPATWTVLAFFYVHYKLPLLILTVGGAAFSSLGRLVLALATRRWGRKVVPAKKRAEIDALGTWLDRRPSWQVPLAVFVCSLGLVPSNQLFIAAGLTTIRLAPVVAGFFAGRAVSYTVSAMTVSKAANSLEKVLRNYWSSPSAWVIQLLSLAVIVGFTMIPWTKVLHIPVPAATGQTQSTDTVEGPDQQSPPPATSPFDQGSASGRTSGPEGARLRTAPYGGSERSQIMADAEGMITENVRDTIAPGLAVYDNEGKKVGTVRQIHRVPGYFQVQTSPFSDKDLHVPFRLITTIDPRELFLSVSRDELHRDYATPPPRSTRVLDEDGIEIAITTEPSGHDGTPIVVQRARIDDLKDAITVGDRVFSSDPTDLGTVKQYDPATGWMWIAKAETANEPTLRVPVAIVDAVNRDGHDVYLVLSEADLERMAHLEPA